MARQMTEIRPREVSVREAFSNNSFRNAMQIFQTWFQEYLNAQRKAGESPCKLWRMIDTHRYSHLIFWINKYVQIIHTRTSTASWPSVNLQRRGLRLLSHSLSVAMEKKEISIHCHFNPAPSIILTAGIIITSVIDLATFCVCTEHGKYFSGERPAKRLPIARGNSPSAVHCLHTKTWN